jgi:hypothetical protein
LPQIKNRSKPGAPGVSKIPDNEGSMRTGSPIERMFLDMKF